MVKVNSIKLNSLSLFKIIIITLICIHFHNIYLYIISFIYLLLTERKYVIFFIIFSLLIHITNTYRYDYFPVGIVVKENNKSYIVDKLLYKVKVNNNNNLKLGDILLFEKAYEINDYMNDHSKNIIFKGDDYKIIYHLKIKDLLLDRIERFDDDTRSIINQLLFNIYDYDNVQYNLGYGLVTYYFLKNMKDRNRYLFICVLCIFSILFGFDNKYILLIIESISDHFDMDKYLKLTFKLFIISLININLFHNYSFIIPILFNLYSLFDMNIDFMSYLCLIQSILFGEINIINTLLFNLLIRYKILLFVSALIIVFVPYLRNIFIFLVSIITYINNLNIVLKGKITIIGFIIYFIVIKLFNINKKYRLILILLIIMLPINNPFFHITFIDVGQGDSTLIKYALERKCVLIDTGSVYNYYKLKRQLDFEGIYTIDYLIISHDDADHNGNIERLKKDYNVLNIIYEGKDIELDNIVYRYLYLGNYDNDNDNSLVYLLNIEGNNILFTGDISNNVEKDLIKKYNLDIDILKLSHHGSDTSSSEYFISSLLPKYGIISTSGQYGHPAKSVLNTLDRYNCRYFITRNDGNIKLFYTRLLKIFKTDRGEFVIIK